MRQGRDLKVAVRAGVHVSFEGENGGTLVVSLSTKVARWQQPVPKFSRVEMPSCVTEREVEEWVDGRTDGMMWLWTFNICLMPTS